MDNKASLVLDSIDEVHLERDAGGVETYVLRGVSPAHPGRWRISLAGIDSREDASRLTGRIVMVARAALELGEEEMLVSDLPGRPVLCEDTEVGTVSATYHNGVHEVIVIDMGGRCVDFPVTEEHVEGFDDDGRLVIVGFEDYEPLAYASRKDERR